MTNQIVASDKKPLTAADWLKQDSFKNSLKMALPKHMNPDRMSRIALTELRRTPKLSECNPMSFVGAVIQCSQLGLEPGNNLGHAYLIPYGKECQLIIGYRGMIDLARRSGQVVSLQAHVVHENDTFEFEYGLTPKLRHVPARSNHGNFAYVYACATLKDGGAQFEVMSREDIEQIMAASKSSRSGPWQTHFDEMARKTVIRRLFKYLPVSVEMTQAVTLDEAAESGMQNNSAIIEHEDTFVDDNGEVHAVPAGHAQAISKAERISEVLKS